MTSAAKQRRAPDWYEWDAVQRGRINAPDPRHIRRLTDEKLHELIRGRLEERYRVAIDRELKRRDAWANYRMARGVMSVESNPPTPSWYPIPCLPRGVRIRRSSYGWWR